MAEVTNERTHEILRRVQIRPAGDEHVAVELPDGQNAIRGHIESMQGDRASVYGVPSRIDQRLERIEGRLELREVARPGTPFDPAS